MKENINLIEDMVETMYEADGVGLAAPQVGIFKRIIVVDIGDENGTMNIINPEIVETNGIQSGLRRMFKCTRRVNSEVKRPN